MTAYMENLTNEQHHARPEVNASSLKVLDRSPAHYFDKFVCPDLGTEKEPTEAMKIGTAIHSAVLEPEKFESDYVVVPQGLERRTKEGKAAWEIILCSGKTPIAQSAWANVLAISKAVNAHPLIKKIRGMGCLFEQSMFWQDDETGVYCKSRPDWTVLPCSAFPNGLLIDLKSTDDARPKEFGRSAINYDMHIQAAHYRNGAKRVFETAEHAPFMWIAVEKESPYQVAIYSAPQSFIDFGHREVSRLLKLYNACATSGHWPGYSACVQEFQIPTWAEKEFAGGE